MTHTFKNTTGLGSAQAGFLIDPRPLPRCWKLKGVMIAMFILSDLVMSLLTSEIILLQFILEKKIFRLSGSCHVNNVCRICYKAKEYTRI